MLYVRGYTGEGFAAGFIKRFTFGTYSHVSLVFDLNGSVEEIEAIQGKGVIRHAPKDTYKHPHEEFTVNLTEEQIVNAHIWALGTLDSDYDWKGIFGFVRRKNKHNIDKWFCSELVAYVLYRVGHPLSRREPYRETPSTVCESFQINPKPLEIGGA